jgi:stage III sporulation protein AE
MIIAVSVASQFIANDDKFTRLISTFSLVCISLCVIVPLGECLSRVLSAIKVSADFMLALIPVLVAVLAVSGNPTAAFSYNSLCFYAAQIVVAISSGFIRPLIQATLSLSMMGSLTKLVNFEKIIQFIKRFTMFLMSFTSSVFITMLTLKGMLSASADTVAVRGIRFMIGNLIPVVGGAVSDAYSSISGTLLLVKNTAAVFGIVAVIFFNLPVMIECMCWVISFACISTVSEMFSQNNTASLIRSVSSCVVMMTVMLLFIIIVFILSIGLVMLMKGGFYYEDHRSGGLLCQTHRRSPRLRALGCGIRP